MPSNSERALTDILKMFGANYWDISFTEDGLVGLVGLFTESLGAYFEKLEQVDENKNKDLWSDPNLKEMPQFILGYVVAQIAIALKNVSPTKAVDATTINLIGTSVMKDGKTEQNCAFMLASYHKKVARRDPTPICYGVRARKEPSEAKPVEEKPADRKPAEAELAEEKRPKS